MRLSKHRFLIGNVVETSAEFRCLLPIPLISNVADLLGELRNSLLKGDLQLCISSSAHQNGTIRDGGTQSSRPPAQSYLGGGRPNHVSVEFEVKTRS